MGSTIEPTGHKPYQYMSWKERVQAQITFLEDPANADKPLPEDLFNADERAGNCDRVGYARYLRGISIGGVIG